MPKNTLAVAFSLLLCLGTLAARGGEKDQKNFVPVSSFSPYQKGAWEFQALAGSYLDLHVFKNQPRINYALESLRLGYMVTDLTGESFLRGNFEILLEAFGGETFTGPGNYLVGGDLLFRWNFVQNQDQKLVPYFQLGGGGLYNDIGRDKSQFIFGGTGEFMLHAGLGLRYRLNEKWALDGEIGYRHISDADTTKHNLGLNSLGAQVGFSYFY